MTAVVAPLAPTAPAGRFGGLLRAELHRFAARRFIRVLLLLAVGGWVLGVVLSLVNFASPSPGSVADARAQITTFVEQNNEYRQDCITQAGRPEGVSDDDWCGTPSAASDYSVADFLDPRPFSLNDLGTAGTLAVGAAVAVLAFLLGATFVGAEWSSRSIVALLFWEPRRVRVVGAKLLVVAGVGAVLGVLAQAVWIGTAEVLQSLVGDGQAVSEQFWPELLGAAGRSVLLVVLAGLIGFGLANVVRNTGASLGIGFVYFAIVENVVRAVRPAWEPWLLTGNAVGLVTPGGYTWYTYKDTFDDQGNLISESIEHTLSNLHAGVFLTVVTLVVVGIGGLLFARRDLQ